MQITLQMKTKNTIVLFFIILTMSCSPNVTVFTEATLTEIYRKRGKRKINKIMPLMHSKVENDSIILENFDEKYYVSVYNKWGKLNDININIIELFNQYEIKYSRYLWYGIKNSDFFTYYSNNKMFVSKYKKNKGYGSSYLGETFCIQIYGDSVSVNRFVYSDVLY